LAFKKETPDYSDLPIVSRKEAKRNGLAMYFTGVPCLRGHLAPRKVQDKGCTICNTQKYLAWQKRQYLLNGDEFRATLRKRREKDLLATILRVSRNRAQKKGIEFTITKADVAISDNCPCCGKVMAVKTGSFKPGPVASSPSLDRMDSSLGYIPGNVAIICWRCNHLKNDGTLDELKTIVRWMEETQGRKLRLVVQEKKL